MTSIICAKCENGRYVRLEKGHYFCAQHPGFALVEITKNGVNPYSQPGDTVLMHIETAVLLIEKDARLQIMANEPKNHNLRTRRVGPEFNPEDIASELDKARSIADNLALMLRRNRRLKDKGSIPADIDVSSTSALAAYDKWRGRR